MSAEPLIDLALVDLIPDPESASVLIATGRSDAQVRECLSDDSWRPGTGRADWGVLGTGGPVLAVELSGWGDPPEARLRALAAPNGVVALARSNLDGQCRFALAERGEIVVDIDDFDWDDDRHRLPVELAAQCGRIVEGIDLGDIDICLILAQLATSVYISKADMGAAFALLSGPPVKSWLQIPPESSDDVLTRAGVPFTADIATFRGMYAIAGRDEDQPFDAPAIEGDIVVGSDDTRIVIRTLSAWASVRLHLLRLDAEPPSEEVWKPRIFETAQIALRQPGLLHFGVTGSNSLTLLSAGHWNCRVEWRKIPSDEYFTEESKNLLGYDDFDGIHEHNVVFWPAY